jgi:hypothetical protein
LLGNFIDGTCLFWWNLHARADLLHQALVNIVDPWVAIYIILQPRYYYPHYGHHAVHLKDAVAAALAHNANENVWTFQDD